MAQMEIKNRAGLVIGYIKDQADGRKVATTRQGIILGYYNPKTNETRDRQSNLLAKGDILSGMVFQSGELPPYTTLGKDNEKLH